MGRLDRRLIIPTAFEDCLTYGQKQAFMWEQILKLEERVKALEVKLAEKEDGNNGKQ